MAGCEGEVDAAISGDRGAARISSCKRYGCPEFLDVKVGGGAGITTTRNPGESDADFFARTKRQPQLNCIKKEYQSRRP